MLETNNPLLVAHPLPPFKAIQEEHIEPAITTLIQENLALIEELTNSGGIPTWETLVAPLEAAEDRLSCAWSPISHLNSVANTPTLRKIYHNCLSKISE